MRKYRCYHTGAEYTCTYDSATGQHKMVDANGKELKEYIASAFTGKEYKFPDNSRIKLQAGELINLHLCVTWPSHYKFIIDKRFRRFTL